MKVCDYLLPRAVLGWEEAYAPCLLPDGHAGMHDTGRIRWLSEDDCPCCMNDIEDAAARCFTVSTNSAFNTKK